MKTFTVRGVTFGEGTPKICVPIVGKTCEEIYAAADRMMDQPVDMVEWRADWFRDVECGKTVQEVLKGLRARLKAMPLLLTYRTKAEGGEGRLGAEDYLGFNLRAVQSKDLDFLDVELSIGEKKVLKILEAAHCHGVKVILSSHDFQKTPKKEEIIRRFCAMQALGGDMLKIALMPNCKKDVLTLMEATLEMKEKWADRPLIAMSMSGVGSISRLSGEFFGSAVTFGSFGRSSAPGQVPVEELKESMRTIHESLHKEEKKGNLYLIGFMGCGKSSVAAELEKSWNLGRLEMDQEIERQQGMEIPEIFEKFGEPYFRKIEGKLLGDLAHRQGMVVSCGGGVVLKQENVELMKQHGKIILLTAEPETILERIKEDETRPLLKGKKSVEEIRNLMDRRREAYMGAADLVIETDGKSVKEICEELIKCLKNAE